MGAHFCKVTSASASPLLICVVFLALEEYLRLGGFSKKHTDIAALKTLQTGIAGRSSDKIQSLGLMSIAFSSARSLPQGEQAMWARRLSWQGIAASLLAVCEFMSSLDSCLSGRSA